MEKLIRMQTKHGQEYANINNLEEKCNRKVTTSNNREQ